jgi:hypothetical protein
MHPVSFDISAIAVSPIYPNQTAAVPVQESGLILILLITVYSFRNKLFIIIIND